MADDVTDMLEIKTAIVEMRGELRVLSMEMRGGDKDQGAAVKLLAQNVDNLTKNLAETRSDVKEALKEWRQSNDQMKSLLDTTASTIRMDLERQLDEHMHDDAPHNASLGSRISSLEKTNTQIKTVLAIVAFLVTPGVAVAVKFIGG